jgi:phosphatidylserine synthase
LGILMLSPIHFPKAPLITFRSTSTNSILLLILMICSLSLIIWRGFVLLPICIGYIVFNIFLWVLKMRPSHFKF